MVGTSQTGKKVLKTEAFARHLAQRESPRRFFCYESGCGVETTSTGDLARHQAARQHGPHRPRTNGEAVSVAA